MTSPFDHMTSNQSILCVKKNNAMNATNTSLSPLRVHQLHPGNRTMSNMIKTTSPSAVDVRFVHEAHSRRNRGHSYVNETGNIGVVQPRSTQIK